MSKRTKVLLVLAIGIVALIIGAILLPQRHVSSDLPLIPEEPKKLISENLDKKTRTDPTEPNSQVYAAATQSNQNHAIESPEMQHLADETVESVSKKAMSLLDNPVHPGRVRLQKQMKQETTEETFSRLADNDSLLMLVPVMGAQSFAAGLYPSDVMVMCKMTRIRKLLADARANPEKTTAFLVDQLRIIGKDFPRARKEWRQRWRSNSVNGGMRTSEWPDSEKYKLKSTAAVYILSEINAFASLPALAWISMQGEPRDDDPEIAGTCFVNRKFVFYAMHKLVSQFPEESLSKEAVKIREKYLGKAGDRNITETNQRKVALWDAYYHEDDFRRTLLGKKLYMSGQPSIELSRFPSLGHLTTQDIEDLLVDLRRFTRLAFPDSKTME